MKIFALILSLITAPVFAANLSDAVDANKVPAAVEERENEEVNLPDAVDTNKIPTAFEEREKEEEWREDYDEVQEDMRKQNEIKNEEVLYE